MPEIATIKTLDEWNRSGKVLNEFLQLGDYVDDAMAEYFISVLPPITWTIQMIQIGEPYRHVKGKPTYSTLYRVYGKPWQWVGHCYEGSFAEAA